MSTQVVFDFHRAALLVIDVQVGIDEFFADGRNNPQAEANIGRLIKSWRNSGREVIHVKHNSTTHGSPLRPESPGNQFKPEAVPLASEKLFEKTVNSAFIGTDLEAYCRSAGISELVIIGLTTDHCVSTSVRMAANLGFNVVLVSDATATNDRVSQTGEAVSAEQIHAVHLLSLDGEFCQVMTTDEIMPLC